MSALTPPLGHRDDAHVAGRIAAPPLAQTAPAPIAFAAELAKAGDDPTMAAAFSETGLFGRGIARSAATASEGGGETQRTARLPQQNVPSASSWTSNPVQTLETAKSAGQVGTESAARPSVQSSAMTAKDARASSAAAQTLRKLNTETKAPAGPARRTSAKDYANADQNTSVRVALAATQSGLVVLARVATLSQTERVLLDAQIRALLAAHGIVCAQLAINGVASRNSQHRGEG